MAELLKLSPSTKFKKDMKKIAGQGKNRQLLNDIVEKLQRKESLPAKHCDHPLVGEYKGFRECHNNTGLVINLSS